MLRYFSCLCLMITVACNNTNQEQSTKPEGDINASFKDFQPRFLDAYWKANPSSAIYVGYGKYYDELIIPDSNAFMNSINFSKQWLDSLYAFKYNDLSDDNKIDYNIIQNQLQSNIWYIDTFKSQQRDPSAYNLGGECYYLLYAELCAAYTTPANTFICTY